MFEPVTGLLLILSEKELQTQSDRFGRLKMMLDHFGEQELGSHLLEVIEQVTESGIITPDVGGSATTSEVTDQIISHLKK